MPETLQPTHPEQKPSESLVSLWFYYLSRLITTELQYRDTLSTINQTKQLFENAGLKTQLTPEISALIDATDPFCKEAKRLHLTSSYDFNAYSQLLDTTSPPKNPNATLRRNEIIMTIQQNCRQVVRDQGKEVINVTLERLHLRKGQA